MKMKQRKWKIWSIDQEVTPERRIKNSNSSHSSKAHYCKYPCGASVRGNFPTGKGKFESSEGGLKKKEKKDRERKKEKKTKVRLVVRSVYFKVRYPRSRRARRTRRRGSFPPVDGRSASRKSNFAARGVILDLPTSLFLPRRSLPGTCSGHLVFDALRPLWTGAGRLAVSLWI